MNPQFPVDFQAIRVALVREIEKITGRVCIQQEIQGQDNPRPPLPYFAFKFISPAIPWGDDAFTSEPDTDPPSSARRYNYGGQRSIAVSLHCYGKSQDEAYQYMTLVQAKLQDETVLMDLRRSSIAVWDVGTVADLSQLLNTAYEGRTQMDITLGVASNLGADLGEIESVTISGEIDEETDEIDVGPVES